MNPKTIMLIDDESDTRVYLFDLLNTEGYRVQTFENPYEALTKVHGLNPDAILLDVRMPQVDGLDFLPMLRLTAPGVPIIILTAFANSEVCRKARELGAFDIVAKPFRVQTLLKTLTTALSAGKSGNA